MLKVEYEFWLFIALMADMSTTGYNSMIDWFASNVDYEIYTIHNSYLPYIILDRLSLSYLLYNDWVSLSIPKITDSLVIQ